MKGIALLAALSLPLAAGRTGEDPDKWNEVGQQSRHGGTTWVKFFEMNLDRVR